MKVVGLKIFTETLPGANQLIFSTVMNFGRTWDFVVTVHLSQRDCAGADKC